MKLGVVAEGFEQTQAFQAFMPLLVECGAVYAPARELPAQQPDAVLLCTDLEKAASELPPLIEAGLTVYFIPANPVWPLPVQQLTTLMQAGDVRILLPEIFLLRTLSLKKALESPLVGPVGTVNLLRMHSDAASAPALMLQDIWTLVWLFGGAQVAFAQHAGMDGKESAFLSLQMQNGALMSLCAYTGTPGEAFVHYDCACRDGVISGDSRRQPLSIHLEGQGEERFPGEEMDYADALRSAWEAAVNGGMVQNKVFMDGLQVAAMMEESFHTFSVARKGANV